MPGAVSAARVAAAALKSEREALVASIADVRARIDAINVALDALEQYDNAPEVKGVSVDVSPVNDGDAMTQRKAVLQVLSTAPGPVSGHDILRGMAVLGVVSTARDPLSALDSTINELQKAGAPISRVGQRVFLWKGPPSDPSVGPFAALAAG